MKKEWNLDRRSWAYITAAGAQRTGGGSGGVVPLPREEGSGRSGVRVRSVIAIELMMRRSRRVPAEETEARLLRIRWCAARILIHRIINLNSNKRS